jgi:SAM-dependent methyltransferase
MEKPTNVTKPAVTKEPAATQETRDPADAKFHVDAMIRENNPWYVDEQAELQLRGKYRFVYRDRLRLLRGCLEGLPARGGVALDAGCGDGMYLAALADSGLRAVGCDYNMLRLERARRRAPEAALLLSDLRQMPVKTGAADFILCSQVLEHFSDPRPAVAELCRALKPGGRALIGVPNDGCLFAAIRFNVLQKKLRETSDHKAMFSKKSLTRLLSECGLDAVSVIHMGVYVPSSWLHEFLNKIGPTHVLMNALGSTLFRTQAAAIYVLCEKRN